ncbi:MAG: hypothetical protein WAV56_03625 [Microgenomates group bacterium]
MGERGGQNYDAAAIARRRERASTMARNNTPWAEAINEESTAAVMAVLGNRELFPWIEGVEVEKDRLGDDDWERKTDAYVYVDPRLCPFGLLDQYRIQIKSGWGDFSGLAANEIDKLVHLTYREWQKLGLVVLFGQGTNESIAASFCLQMINHMGIAGKRNARELFLSFQTVAVQTMLLHFEAMDIAGRDWEKLLFWVATGRVKREEYGSGGNKVVFI